MDVAIQNAIESNRRSDAPVWLTARMVEQRFGICAMTLFRWTRREGMEFPQPAIIANRKFWRRDEIELWEQRQLAQRRHEAAARSAV